MHIYVGYLAIICADNGLRRQDISTHDIDYVE